MAHHLLVPDGVPADDVEALVRSRYPETDDDGGPRLHLQVAPGCAVAGPVTPPAGSPAWATAAYELIAPVERGGPVPDVLRGRGGLLDAFAAAEPIGREREMLELGLAMARRLGGGVHAEGSASALVPEPRADLLVYGDVWLHPDALVHVLTPVLPGIGLPGAPAPRGLPADAATGAPGVTDPGELRWLHAEADAYDAAAAVEPEAIEAYAAVATDPDGTTWSVLVEAATTVPPVLGVDAARASLLYEIRCHPGQHRQLPDDAQERIDGAARALVGALPHAVVVDDDGFLVDLSAT